LTVANRLSVRQRRWLLVAHVVAMGACLGGDLGLLVLKSVALANRDPLIVGTAHIGAELLDLRLVRPAAIASVFTGALLSVLGPWGLTRHYWVILKQVLSVAFIGLATEPTAEGRLVRTPGAPTEPSHAPVRSR